MKLINMEMSQEEAEEYGGPGSSLSDAPKYPYGLSIELDDDALEKLGLDKDLPEVGSELIIMAKANVVGVHENESMNGESEASVRLQITDLACEEPLDKLDPEKALYGEDDKD